MKPTDRLRAIAERAGRARANLPAWARNELEVAARKDVPWLLERHAELLRAAADMHAAIQRVDDGTVTAATEFEYDNAWERLRDILRQYDKPEDELAGFDVAAHNRAIDEALEE